MITDVNANQYYVSISEEFRNLKINTLRNDSLFGHPGPQGFHHYKEITFLLIFQITCTCSNAMHKEIV